VFVDLTTAVHAARLVEGGLAGRRSAVSGRRAAGIAAETASGLRARAASSGFRVDRLIGPADAPTGAHGAR
jgi:hypothetical protein